MLCMMKTATTLAVAILLVPLAEADEQSENEDGQWPHCLVFWYSLAPPGFRLDPGCLFPLPKPVQEVVDEVFDPDP